jgi:hypothetical protein
MRPGKHKPSRRASARAERTLRPAAEILEQRIVMAIPPHAAGNDSYEVYAWALINQMRENPAVFGNTIVKLYNKQIGQAYGLSSSDPVWDDIRSAVKYFDGRPNADGSVWRFSEWQSFITSQNYSLGPLAIEPDLSQGAYKHTTWMTVHGYGHSISATAPASSASIIRQLPGWQNQGVNGQPDRVQLGSSYTGSWGEDIGAQDNGIGYSYQAWTQGKFPDTGYYQRAVFYDTMAYLIDWGNGAHTDSAGNFHPAYGHLMNLLSNDQTSGDLGLSSGSGPKNKTIQKLDAIGIDYYFYQNGDGHPNDGLAGSWASTHRLARKTDDYNGHGGYIVAFNYVDKNGDGFYTPGIGEGAPLAFSESYSYDGLTITTTVYGYVAYAGLITLDYVPDTSVDLSLSVGGKDVGHQTVNVRGRNVLVKAPVSAGFGLTDGSTLTLGPDFAEPDDTSDLAYSIGAFDPNTPRSPFAGLLSIDTATDQDWYRFEVTSGGQANLRVGYKASQGDLDAAIYRQNGSGGLDLVTTMTNSGDDENYIGQLSAGTYFLKVYGYNSAKNFYNLSVNIDFPAGLDPVGDSIAAAAATGIVAGVPGTYSSNQTLILDDVDVYQVGLAAGMRCSVQTALPAGSTRATDTRLRVFDASGNEIAGDDDRAGSSYSALSFVAPATGSYYVSVSGFDNAMYDPTRAGSGSSNQRGDYSIAIETGPDGSTPFRLGQAALAIAASQEAYMNFVTQAYRTYLGRDPEAAGLNHWLDAMLNHGLTDEQLEAFFIGSPEYIANHGGPGAGWVTGMYQDLLGRTPAASEVSFWLASLSNGLTTFGVALGFAASAEREGIRVRANYANYLGRTASDAEVAAWVGRFTSSQVTNEIMVAGFVGSPEYFLKSGKGASLTTDWARSAYIDVLGRSASDADVASWSAFLS